MLNRRDFLHTLAGLTAGLMVPSPVSAQTQPAPTATPGATRASSPATSPTTGPATRPGRDRLGELLPQRRLGRTGAAVTMLGLGGWHVGAMNERDAQATIEMAIEQGVRYFDNAESYHDGKSEKYYGRFLTPKFREEVFITTKTVARDERTAREHLKGSLERLGVGSVDLWKIHAIDSRGDVDGRIARGVLEVFLEARRNGQARFIGFSGHTHPEAHLRLLELMAKDDDPLSACMLPINVVDPSYLSFIQGVLPVLNQRGLGVIAMKSLAGGNFMGKPVHRSSPIPPKLVPDRFSLREAMHFVWSMPVSLVVSGPDTPAQFREMIGLARAFSAMTAAERTRLIDLAADAAGTTVEWYKRRPS